MSPRSHGRTPSHRQQSAKGKEVAVEPQSAQPAEGHSESEKSSPAGGEPTQADDVGNGIGNASTSDHSAIPHPSSSTPPDSAGQAPPSAAPPAAARSADSIPIPRGENGTVRKDKVSGSLESEQTGTNTFKGSPRKDASKSVSDGVHTSTTEGEPADSAKARRSKGLLSKLLRVLVPCVGPSSRAHAVDLDEKAQAPRPSSKPQEAASADLKEKQAAKEAEDLPPAPQEPATTPTGAQASTSDAEIPPPLQPIDIPEQPDDPNVIVPPTPTKTLPLEETEGVTSGAVQPPGSTGESLHNHSRRNSRDMGEDSDGSTSFTDDEELDEGTPVDEVEDEEERLIMQGGAGIPIGPVSYYLAALRMTGVRRLSARQDGIPRPLLPPISPKHAGRKCLVLDLDETLVHSSFKVRSYRCGLGCEGDSAKKVSVIVFRGRRMRPSLPSLSSAFST